METSHWVILAAMLGAFAMQINGLHNWHEALAPSFIGGLLALVSTNIAGLFTNKVGSKAATEGAVSADTMSRIAPMVLLAIAVGATSGCAMKLGTVRHGLTVSAVSAHGVLSIVQDTEDKLVCGKSTAPAAPSCVGESQHRANAAILAKAFREEIAVAAYVRDMPETATLTPDLSADLADISAAINRVLAAIPDSAMKAALISKLGGQ